MMKHVGTKVRLIEGLRGVLGPGSFRTVNIGYQQRFLHAYRYLCDSDSSKGLSKGSNGYELKYITERDRLIANSTSNWEKLRINIRWILTKQTKPLKFYNLVSTSVVSGIYLGNILLFIFGTTTFVSLIVIISNLFSDKSSNSSNFLAKHLGNYITKNTNYFITFENATTTRSNGKTKIILHNVFVSRRPYKSHGFEIGSQLEAVQRADLSLRDSNILINDPNFDDGNYTQFDLTIDSMNISFSLQNWLNGKGMVKELDINGVRGIIDRTHVKWLPNDDPRNYKNQYKVGDFEIETFTVTDVLFTLYQPNRFRPFQISIYNLILPQLRKNWFFYDCLNAKYASGTFDNSMFTIHKKLSSFKKIDNESIVNGKNTQKKKNKFPIIDDVDNDSDTWKCKTRLRVDNLDIDHLNADIEGPLSWITEGKVDMIGDIMVPNEELLSKSSGQDLQSLFLNEITENLRLMTKDYSILYPMLKNIDNKPISEVTKKPLEQQIESSPHDYFVMDLFLKLHNVKAEVPYFTPELSYLNYALIRPIVGFINSNRTYIPIRCRIVKKIDDFEGAWTMFDSMLINDLQIKIYDAINDYVDDDRKTRQRLQRVGFWSLQIVLQMILMSLGAIA